MGSIFARMNKIFPSLQEGGFDPGTTRQWKDGEHVKQDDGTWAPTGKGEEGGASKDTTPEKDEEDGPSDDKEAEQEKGKKKSKKPLSPDQWVKEVANFQQGALKQVEEAETAVDAAVAAARAVKKLKSGITKMYKKMNATTEKINDAANAFDTQLGREKEDALDKIWNPPGEVPGDDADEEEQDARNEKTQKAEEEFDAKIDEAAELATCLSEDFPEDGEIDLDDDSPLDGLETMQQAIKSAKKSLVAMGKNKCLQGKGKDSEEKDEKTESTDLRDAVARTRGLLERL